MSRLIFLSSLLAAAIAFAGDGGQAGRYTETDDYLNSAFPAGPPAPSTLWVSGDMRDSIEAVLGHRFGSLRLRYWFDGETSAWVIDEVGKDLPITIGVTVRDGAIADLQVLEFRESRGWEVRYPFFTGQFLSAKLTEALGLDQPIDSITGATLSVSAVTRVARVALILDRHVHAAG